jgi:hypothetical protein
LGSKLKALQSIAELILDHQLLKLRSAAAARDDTKVKLAALDPRGNFGDCSIRSSAQAELLYESWADGRRRELNLHLARQTAAVLQAEDHAKFAFGRQIALNRLSER